MDELDDKLQELAAEYHEPQPVPRDEMWERIRARREATAAAPARVLPLRTGSTVRRAIVAAAGLAAVLAIGVAIGRGTARVAVPLPDEAVPVATGGSNTTALDVAARAHLRQAESYLTLFRASVRAGDVQDLADPTARELLATNRLLMHAPGTDPRLRVLLVDLELVLAEIAQLQASQHPEDLELITNGLDRAGMLTRLRAASPVPQSPITTGVS